jgi:hypothetical protein
MSTLKSTIEDLASQFAISIIGALRTASIAEVMEVTSGTSVARTSSGVAASARRSAGRPRRAAKAEAPTASAPAKGGKRAGRPGRLGRRSVADIGRMVDDVEALLQQHPDGLRAEQIRSALGVQAKELPRPLADGLAEGRLSKTGQKRATTYFAGGSTGRGKKRR